MGIDGSQIKRQKDQATKRAIQANKKAAREATNQKNRSSNYMSADKADNRLFNYFFNLTALVCLILAAYLLIGPPMTLSKIREAALNQNNTELEALLNYPQLESNLKKQYIENVSTAFSNSKIDDATFSELVSNLTQIITQETLSPKGLLKIIDADQPTTDGEKGLYYFATNFDYSLKSPSEVIAKIKSEQPYTMEVALRRHGIQWEVTNLLIPENKAVDELISKTQDDIWDLQFTKMQTDEINSSDAINTTAWHTLNNINFVYQKGTKLIRFVSNSDCMNAIEYLGIQAKQKYTYSGCKKGISKKGNPDLTCVGKKWGFYATCDDNTLGYSY